MPALPDRRWPLVAGVVVAGVVAAAVGAAVAIPMWLAAAPTAPTAPTERASLLESVDRRWDGSTATELGVTCTDDGPVVDAEAVAAQADGVTLVLNSTLPKGGYLTYAAAGNGPNGGDPLPGGAAPATYPFPPGELTLGCAVPPGMDETGSVTVDVADPHGFWREITLADLGCVPSSAQPSWAIGPAEAATAREAVDAVLAELGGEASAEPVATGYASATTQTWVVTEDGVPSLSITVKDRGDRYEAAPDLLCG